MTQESILGPAISLPGDRSLQPPAGWMLQFSAPDDGQWLLPKSEMRWTPEFDSQAFLKWGMSAGLPGEQMNALITILLRRLGPVSLEAVGKLHPSLVSIPVDLVIDSRAVSYPKSGQHLVIRYASKKQDQYGIVLYAPTENFDRGEYQFLGYEGREPDYSRYLNLATSAIDSFAIGKFRDISTAELTNLLFDSMVTTLMSDDPVPAAPMASPADPPAKGELPPQNPVTAKNVQEDVSF